MLDYMYNQDPHTNPKRSNENEGGFRVQRNQSGIEEKHFGYSQSSPCKVSSLLEPISSLYVHSKQFGVGSEHSALDQAENIAPRTPRSTPIDINIVTPTDAPSGCDFEETSSHTNTERHFHKQQAHNPDPFSFTFSGHNNGRSLLAAQISSKFDDVVVHHTNTIDNATFGSISKDRYKTELCRSWAETGYCRYGDKCQFAHGDLELRQVSRHHKYKSELCNNFHYEGTCMYGTRCCFIHSVDKAVIGRAVSQNIDIVPLNPITNKMNSLIKSYEEPSKIEDVKQQPEKSYSRSYSASCTL
ncbi:hypothetical protein AKO1_014316 [Acrasis kona]|uniref:C3H1-type domain-containing protein n=1 Tax=Acrasis kona TaxID=1008807 RepID=A0AAW2YZP8_9EUKA